MSTPPIETALNTLVLQDRDKTVLTLRVTDLLREYKKRSSRYSYSFNTLRILISVGSLIVPSVLTIEYSRGDINDCPHMGQGVFWVVWLTSLLVTISNGIVALLKIDKKYYTLNTTYQHITSEAWQYIELSGKYSGFYTPGQEATHQNQFIYFCHVIEKLRMKQVEDEYYKIVDQHHSTVQAQTSDSLIPPTPLKEVFAAEEKSGTEVNGEHQTTVKRIHSSAKVTAAPFFPEAAAGAGAGAGILPRQTSGATDLVEGRDSYE